MFSNYFKTAWRNLQRNRQTSVINILGLALGIAVFLLIMQYVAGEWRTNRFHENFSRLYRIDALYKEGTTGYYMPPGVAPLAKEKLAGVEAYVRLGDGLGNGVFTVSEGRSEPKAFREEQVLYADSNFFQVFSFPIVAGQAVLPANKLALSETMSRKLFGEEAAVGKTVSVSNQFGNTPYTVAAVFNDMAEQSDIKATVVLSLQTLDNAANRGGNDWAAPSGFDAGYTNSFLLLRPGVEASQIAAQLSAIVHGLDPASSKDQIFLHPLKQLHLAPSFTYPYQSYGSLKLVTILAAVALLILFIAWVNYINLSTAQALNRAREVGVRKVLGARRSQLIVQYLSETFLLTLASVVAALVLVRLAQPFFNAITGKALSLQVLNQKGFWITGVLLILLSSLLAGGYVAVQLSAHKPVVTLRGPVSTSGKKLSFGRGLVVFQFTISIVFIIATLVLYRQLQFMQTEQLGMNLNQLLVVKGPTVTTDAQEARNTAFKNTLAQLPFVTKYSASNNVPGGGYNFTTEHITKPAARPGDERKSYAMFISDEKFFDTYGITFKQGSTYSPKDAADGWSKAHKVILNEQAVAALGFEKGTQVAGQKIKWEDDYYEVAGVVADYHHLSLHEAIKPTVFLPSSSFVYFTIQTDTRNLASKLAVLKDAYSKHFPGNPFEYFFADEAFGKQYKDDQNLGRVFVSSAAVAILIACLGLFGLVAYAARQRVKEIGIRKVLGATVSNITALLSKDFMRLVLVSLVLAVPLAAWLMHQWLQDFAYRTPLSWWIFLCAGAVAVFIALATVSVQAIKAARANPVQNLRNE